MIMKIFGPIKRSSQRVPVFFYIWSLIFDIPLFDIFLHLATFKQVKPGAPTFPTVKF